jgi:hypothetical protein
MRHVGLGTSFADLAIRAANAGASLRAQPYGFTADIIAVRGPAMQLADHHHHHLFHHP